METRPLHFVALPKSNEAVTAFVIAKRIERDVAACIIRMQFCHTIYENPVKTLVPNVTYPFLLARYEAQEISIQ